MNIKKVFTMLAFVMSLNLLSINAKAYSDYGNAFECVQDETVNIGGATVSFSINKENLTCVIESGSLVDGYHSIKIPQFISYNGQDYAVVGIGNDAFYDEQDLTSIELPHTVTFLDTGAFSATNLSSIVLSPNIDYIGSSAFAYCDFESLDLSVCPNLTELKFKILYYNLNLKDLTLGNNVSRIEEYAFDSCEELESLSLPNNLEYIGIGFVANTNIKYIKIPKSVKEVGKDTWNSYGIFKDAPLLTIEFEEGTTSLVDYILIGASFEELVFPSTLTSFGSYTFQMATIPDNFVIPETIVEIGDKAFIKANLGENFKMSNSVETYGEDIFCSANIGQGFQMPSNITKVPESMFYNANLPSDFSLPSSLVEIGKSSFENSKGIENFEIPEGVEKIGEKGFAGSTMLTGDVSLPKSLKVVGKSAFYGIPCKKMVVNSELKDASQIFNGSLLGQRYDDFKDITIEFANGITQVPEAMFEFMDGENIEVVLPESITTINDSAFNFSDVGHIDLPKNLEIIGDFAFSDANLTSVVIPASVKSIGQNAFENTKIKELKFPSHLKEVPYGCFSDCKNLTTVEIADGIHTVDVSAFSNCTMLNNVKLPSTITVLGSNAFGGCTSLTSIEFPSSLIKIEFNAFKNSGLVDVVLPRKVKFVGKDAFSSKHLKSIKLNSNLSSESISNILKFDVSLDSIAIPYGVSIVNAGEKFNANSVYVPESVSNISFFNNPSKIEGVVSSYAETYAKENGILFEEDSNLVSDFNFLNKPSVLFVDEHFDVSVDIQPQTIKESIVWRSSNTNVVSVDNAGCLVAKKEGVATIYATIGSVTKSFNVKAMPMVSDFEISTSNTYLQAYCVGQKIKLPITTTPSEAVEKVRLSFSKSYFIDPEAFLELDGAYVNVLALPPIGETIYIDIDIAIGNSEKKEKVFTIKLEDKPWTTPKLKTYSSYISWNDFDENANTNYYGVDIFKYDKHTNEWYLYDNVVGSETSYNLEESEKELYKGENNFKVRGYIFTIDGKIYTDFSNEIVYVSDKEETTEKPSEDEEPTTEKPNENPTEQKPEDVIQTKRVVALLSNVGKGYFIKWNDIGAEGYEILRCDSSRNYKVVKSVKSCIEYYIPKSLTPEDYGFAVRGFVTVNGKRVYSDYAKSVYYTVEPAIAKNVKQKSLYTNKIELAWGKLSGVTGYEIWRCKTKSGAYSKVMSVTSNSGKNYVMGGSSYWYRIRAYKTLKYGDTLYGEFSVPMKMYSKPSTVTTKLAKTGSKKVKISWTKSIGANMYEIYMSNSKSGTYKLVASRKNTHKQYYTVNNLTKGRTYYFKIRTYKVDNSGNKIYSNWSDVKSLKLPR